MSEKTEMTPSAWPKPKAGRLFECSRLLWRIRDRLFWTSNPVSWLLWKLSHLRCVAAVFRCKLYACRLSVAFADQNGLFNLPHDEYVARLSDPTKNFYLETNNLHLAVEWCRRGVIEFPEAKCATIAYFDLRKAGYDGTRASCVWNNERGIQLSEGLEERLGLPISPRKSVILERGDSAP